MHTARYWGTKDCDKERATNWAFSLNIILFGPFLMPNANIYPTFHEISSGPELGRTGNSLNPLFNSEPPQITSTHTLAADNCVEKLATWRHIRILELAYYFSTSFKKQGTAICVALFNRSGSSRVFAGLKEETMVPAGSYPAAVVQRPPESPHHRLIELVRTALIKIFVPPYATVSLICFFSLSLSL